MNLRSLDDQACLHYRDQLRDARADVLADAEGFERICFAVEKLGRRLRPDGHSLGQYHAPLLEVVSAALGMDDATEFSAQFSLMTASRNDFMHVGSHARHAGAEALKVATILERALVCEVARRNRIEGLAELRAGDLMVSPIVMAYAWSTLREVRNLMLHNSFTFIPVFDEEQKAWYLLGDAWLATKLAGKGNGARNRYLKNPVQEHIGVVDGLEPVTPVPFACPISDLVGPVRKGLVLVRGREPADKGVVGVIAPADLL